MNAICILGATGVGKSSLANAICGVQNMFKTSADIKSETSEVVGVLTRIEIRKLEKEIP